MTIPRGRTFSYAPTLVLFAWLAIAPAEAIAQRVEIYTGRHDAIPAWASNGPFPVAVDVGSLRLTNFNVQNVGDGVTSFEFRVTGTITNISASPAYMRVITYAGAHVMSGSWQGSYEGFYVDGGPAADGRLDVSEHSSWSSVAGYPVDSYLLTPPAPGTSPPVKFGRLTTCCTWVPENYVGPIAQFEATLGPGDGLDIINTRAVSWSPSTGVPALNEGGVIMLALLLIASGTAMLWKRPRIQGA